ncbi:hypothetical protein EB835_18305 [Brevibacterium sp. S22]|nr:hypothetical protein EB835_18305 [Brevibacterium sp. S22]
MWETIAQLFPPRVGRRGRPWADNRTIPDGFTATAHDLDDAKLCAVDLDLDYADGQPGSITSTVDPFGQNDHKLRLLLKKVNDQGDSVTGAEGLVAWIA